MLTLSIFLITSALLVAGGAKEEYPEDFTLKVTALNGPTGIGMIHLFEEQPQLAEGIKSEYTLAMAPKVLMGDLVKKSIDIAVLPANMPALLHVKAPGYKVAAVTGLGTLYIISHDASIESPEDLKGKTLYNGAKGATPDFLTRYLFTQAGIDTDKDLYMDFSYGLPDLAKAVISGLAETAVLPEPFISMIEMKSDASVVLDLQELWIEQNGTSESYPMSVLVVRDEILESYPELVKNFLGEYEKSINKVNSDPEASAALVPVHGFTMNQAVTEKAIPRLNLEFTSGDKVEEMLTAYYNVLYEMDPKNVGGSVPGSDLYYIED